MKICIVNPGATNQLIGNSSSFGGAEGRSIQLSKILNSEQIAEVSFITSEPVSLPFIKTYSSKPFNRRTLKSKLQNKLSILLPFIYANEEIRLEEQAWDSDVFVVFGVSIMAYSIMKQCKERGKKFILAITSDDCLDCDLSLKLFTKKNPFRCPRWVGYQLIKNSDKIWVQSSFQEEKIKLVFQRECLRIPNPPPFPPQQSVPSLNERSGILWIGKASEVKDPLRGLSIAKQAPDIPFTFIINNLETNLGKECLSFKPTNVTIISAVNRDEISAYLRNHVAIINTSQFEGMPNSFLEACAFGMPIISLRASEDFFNSPLSPGFFANDSDDSMIKYIRMLSSDHNLWGDYSKKATEYLARNHSEDEIIKILRRSLL